MRFNEVTLEQNGPSSTSLRKPDKATDIWIVGENTFA